MKISTILVLFLCAAEAFASTQVSHRKFRDETARAEYSWIEGCTSYTLTIMASRTRLKEDGVTVLNGPSSAVVYSSYKFCDLNNIEQIFWSGSSDSAVFSINSNLRDARLTGSMTLEGIRFTGLQSEVLPPTTVSIDVAWFSDDPIDKVAGAFVTHYPGHHEVNQLNGIYRLATASGVISDGVKNLLPSVPASGLVQIYRLMQGDTVITRD